MNDPVIEQWYTRPVFFVKDVSRSLDFYCNLLGFTTVSDYVENNRSVVAQVNRGEKCELLLAENNERAGKSRIYIELCPDELEILKQEITEKNIPAKDSRWGTPIIEVIDPDGNEIFFPLDEH
jgi:catechol 2,3-dioxygenase-like lactoylglutathione lyase family enzyme